MTLDIIIAAIYQVLSDYATAMKRYVLALDLVDDPALITEYEQHHKAVWPGAPLHTIFRIVLLP